MENWPNKKEAEEILNEWVKNKKLMKFAPSEFAFICSSEAQNER